MQSNTQRFWSRPLRSARLACAVVVTVCAAGNAVHAGESAEGAQGLRARYTALRERLADNQFQRPLDLESVQTESDLKGEIHAVVDYPFTTVESGLKGAERWCDILILHVNVKHCRAGQGSGGSTVAISIGSKNDQPVANAYRVQLDYRVVAASPDYLHIVLTGENGPLSTKNYRIAFEAVPLDARRSFIRMAYSYSYGMAARFAMQGYLATVGRDKVGFSVVGKGPNGQPMHIDGVRGVVERNTMRYYLAIDSYLAAMTSPPAEQLNKRLSNWFDATERYPRQLHEVNRDAYMTMKHKEVRRQQNPVEPRGTTY